MLGLGWTEMLVVGVIALIVIGPKDLPIVMQRVGKFAGQIRRMGNDFQRELNKTTGLDEVRNLRNSIAAPLKKTSDEIRRDFNAMTPTGPKPSGLLKPADPDGQSVVEEIKAAAGITEQTTSSEVGPVKAASAPTRPVIKTELTPLANSSAEAEQSARKVTANGTTEALPSEPADSPAPKTPRQRKAAPAKAPASKTTVASKTRGGAAQSLSTEPADSPDRPQPKARTRKKKPSAGQGDAVGGES
ncbi:MAG TPA: Sec-independent protein translocase protein TatB [Devosia sp.]|jgi:sec-independent protein translocase protein TatB|nr:Sec-independent protein translocase protein TatB [Devosia sp.]